MTRTDRKIVFTALAFFDVVVKCKDASGAKNEERIRELAGLVESFCEENVINVSASVSDEPGALVADQIIERHVRELREDEETRLPEDRQTLIKLFDRLQQRKTRRTRREFYASATDAKLADLVLGLLDEEISGAVVASDKAASFRQASGLIRACPSDVRNSERLMHRV